MVHKKRATRRRARGRHTRNAHTKRNKRHIRQHGGTTDEQIKELLTRYFPTFHRYVNHGKVYLFCNPSGQMGMDLDTNPASIHSASDDSAPIYFEIMPYKRTHKMMLYSLRRCPGHSGTSILQRIIEIGRELSLDSIELEDLSMVGCDYPLYTLSILQHGETWYHRMGFRSDDYEMDKKIHEDIRHQRFEDFVPIMFRAYGEDTMQTYTDDQIRAYLEEWYAIFPEIRGKTVAQVAHMIPRGEEVDCEGRPAALFREFLFMASSALPYEPYVTLDLRSL